jgi:hypothetical protein
MFNNLRLFIKFRFPQYFQKLQENIKFDFFTKIHKEFDKNSTRTVLQLKLQVINLAVDYQYFVKINCKHTTHFHTYICTFAYKHSS